MDDKARFHVRITEMHDKPREKPSDAGETFAVIMVCILLGGLLALGIASVAAK